MSTHRIPQSMGLHTCHRFVTASQQILICWDYPCVRSALVRSDHHQLSSSSSIIISIAIYHLSSILYLYHLASIPYHRSSITVHPPSVISLHQHQHHHHHHHHRSPRSHQPSTLSLQPSALSPIPQPSALRPKASDFRPQASGLRLQSSGHYHHHHHRGHHQRSRGHSKTE